MFENADDLIDALEGEWGPEWQDEAMAMAESLGLFDQWGGEQEQAEDAQYVEEAEERLGALERHIGRKLTNSEVGKVLSGITMYDYEQGLPDLIPTHGEALAKRGVGGDSEGRVARMAEAADDAKAEQEDGQEFEPVGSYEGPAEGDFYDDGDYYE